jgi:predicted RNA polymerase sigma factor
MEAVASMCKLEYQRLVGMLGLYCGDADVAEDLTQEALIRLCQNWRKVSRMDAPERWSGSWPHRRNQLLRVGMTPLRSSPNRT